MTVPFIVRVVEPADDGRATKAALQAIARALGLPRRSVSLVRGATSRRKLIEVELGPSGTDAAERSLVDLRGR